MSNTKKAKATSGAQASATKKERFLGLLRSPDGATIAEVVEVTGWQAHSARAMLTGLRKQGLNIEKTKTGGVTRYAIAAEPAA